MIGKVNYNNDFLCSNARYTKLASLCNVIVPELLNQFVVVGHVQ